MKILLTGVCGFAGSTLAEGLLARMEGLSVCGMDNLARPGSETNRRRMQKIGVEFFHGDIRAGSDFEGLPSVDWVIDAAANPSVLAGVAVSVGSRQLFENNLASLVNVLEYAKAHKAGLILLSSSRVYSIPALCGLPLRAENAAFRLDDAQPLPCGVSAHGIDAGFSTAAPISLYGSTKLAAEAVALEYGHAFGFPVWIDRCGVLAGAGQFGTPDQGIFSYWINAHLRRRRMRYIGFEGTGYQVRDAFYPGDLADLLAAQMRSARGDGQRIYTAGGGAANAISLAQLTSWCDARFGPHAPERDVQPRTYDVPWVIMSNRDARRDFGWYPRMTLETLLSEIAAHAEAHAEWLELSGR